MKGLLVLVLVLVLLLLLVLLLVVAVDIRKVLFFWSSGILCRKAGCWLLLI
jgi:hypothetical protein